MTNLNFTDFQVFVDIFKEFEPVITKYGDIDIPLNLSNDIKTIKHIVLGINDSDKNKKITVVIQDDINDIKNNIRVYGLISIFKGEYTTIQDSIKKKIDEIIIKYKEEYMKRLNQKQDERQESQTSQPRIPSYLSDPTNNNVPKHISVNTLNSLHSEIEKIDQKNRYNPRIDAKSRDSLFTIFVILGNIFDNVFIYNQTEIPMTLYKNIFINTDIIEKFNYDNIITYLSELLHDLEESITLQVYGENDKYTCVVKIKEKELIVHPSNNNNNKKTIQIQKGKVIVLSSLGKVQSTQALSPNTLQKAANTQTQQTQQAQQNPQTTLPQAAPGNPRPRIQLKPLPPQKPQPQPQ